MRKNQEIIIRFCYRINKKSTEVQNTEKQKPRAIVYTGNIFIIVVIYLHKIIFLENFVQLNIFNC